MGYVNYRCKKCGEIMGISKQRSHDSKCKVEGIAPIPRLTPPPKPPKPSREDTLKIIALGKYLSKRKPDLIIEVHHK